MRSTTSAKLRTTALAAIAALFFASACSDDPQARQRTIAGPSRDASVSSGSVWTTLDDCVSAQNANHYALGHLVSLHAANFDPGTYAWSITGNPGGSSGDPSTVVAGGSVTIGTDGAVTNLTNALGAVTTPEGGSAFCFPAYLVHADDWGEYRFAIGNKNDNYRVDGVVDVAKTAAVSWARAYLWAIDKTAAPAHIDIFSGETATFTYNVALVRSPASDVYGISGTVTANNTNTTLPALTPVADCLQMSTSGGWVNVIDCVTLAASLPPGVSTIPYSFASVPLNPANTYRNLATVGGVITATAPITFPANPTAETNATVHVTDTNGEAWTFSGSGTQTYTKSVTCPADHSGYGSHEIENTATITETSASDEADVYYSCNGLTVTKTAATALTRTWTWTADKTAAPATATISPGQTINVGYTVTYGATSANSDFAATGTITIANSNPTRAATLNSVTDALAGSITATVICPAMSVPAAGSLQCTYDAILPDATTRLNTATVVQQLYNLDASGNPTTPSTTDTFTGTASANFSGATIRDVDECVSVSDTFGGSGISGTVCVAGGLPRVYNYTRTISFAEGVCGVQHVTNTAAFETLDRHLTGSDGATATITVACETGCTLTQGYWKTHSLLGPAPYDDNWTTVGGSMASFFPGLTYYGALTTPAGGNAFYQLSRQYIAAKLNVNNGASTPPAVTTAMTTAAALFADPTNTPAYIGSLKGNNTLRNQFISLAGILGSYNEGLVGPGHCTEDGSSVP